MNSIFSYSFKPCEGFLASNERSRVSIGTRTSSEVSHWIGYWKCWRWCSIYWNGKHNPLYPNIRMHILYTVLYNLPEVLTRRICWKIRSCFSGWSFPWPWCLIQGRYCKEKLDVSHSYGQRIEKKNASQLFSASKIACWSTQPPDALHALEARCFWHWCIIFLNCVCLVGQTASNRGLLSV